MTSPDSAELCTLAAEVARLAGEFIVTERPARLDSRTKSSPTDVVTTMDTAAQELIVTELQRRRPDDAILAEESPDSGQAAAVRWVIDPIDGTVNYLYDLPDYAVSIAAEVDGEVVAGVVFNPVRDLMYGARRGHGATCNGHPLACSAQSELSQALVATGFGYRTERRAAQARLLTGVLPAVRDIRRRGAASLDLCAVADGTVDAFYERGLSAWDLAAGGLIAREAGARVGGLHGRAAGPDLVIAAGPSLFPALHDLLAPLGADAD